MERRKHKRFQAKERALVLASSQQPNPYHIIDIGKGGLALRYIGKEEWSDKPEEIVIIYGDECFLKKVPVKFISDTELRDNSYIKKRRLCLQFGKLTSSHKAQLKNFLLHYTVGGAE